MFTRESLFTAPFMILLLEVTVLGNTLTAGIKRAKPHIALLPVIPIMVFLVSAAQNESSLSFSGAINVVNYAGTPVLHYALTQLVVVLNYLYLYLIPIGQNVQHEQMLYTVLYQLPVISSGIIIISMVVSAYYLYRKHQDDKRYALIFVGICWYFLGLAVSSSVIPLPDLMAEHRAYFSAIGFIIALICLLDILRTYIGSVKSNNIMIALIAVWCVILIVLTYNRNKVWESGITLWSNSVKHSPNNHRSNYNLGVAYVYAKNYQESVKYLNKSIEIDPDWAQAYEVLAIALIELKRYQEAVVVSIKGIDVNPANPVYYNNLGIAYAETDRMEDAKQAFSTSLALQPGYINAINNLDRVESYIESSIGSRKR
jgi:tetratricopeptide (TPR) repeat protein